MNPTCGTSPALRSTGVPGQRLVLFYSYALSDAGRSLLCHLDQRQPALVGGTGDQQPADHAAHVPFNYKLGAWLLDRPVLDFEFELTWHWIGHRLVDIGIPLYLV